MDRIQQVLQSANQIAESEEFERFMMNAQDFASQRGADGSATTKLSQSIATLNDAAQVLNKSRIQQDDKGGSVNIVSPVVVPRNHRSWGWAFIAMGMLFALIAVGGVMSATTPGLFWVIFGPHYWAIMIGYVGFHIWKNSYVMIPDGCTALITRFGKVETEVGAGRHYIFNPWKRVGYIVNTTRQYPYNAPIREAATQEQVTASIDLFLQFRIKNPREFIFSLGGVNGFSEKLQNAISEQTRALIYSQRAEDIYDLVGESTSVLLNGLNEQFDPAVEFVSTNITHAEPSSQDYRMDLAAAEMVRVAKEAYTYQYELDLRKKRDEGDVEKELAGLRETLSGISAEVATYEAQISTAHEKEINRANAYASQLMVEAESEANANAALFQAQALDIRALRTADYPEILEYQYKQSVLERLRNVADKLPQIVQVGDDKRSEVNFMALAKEMLGVDDSSLYTDADLAQIRGRVGEISKRIRERHTTISKVTTVDTTDIASVEEVL